MSVEKSAQTRKKRPLKRVMVEKKAFDRVLKRLISSKPVKREDAKSGKN